MKNLTAECIDVILKNEGGYVNHPADPGGETNFGITKARYPELDIKNLTKEQAREIYLKDFWEPMRVEQLVSADLALHVFDFGVNAGRSRAVRLLQRLAGTTIDGLLGPVTAREANKNVTVDAYKEARRNYYKHLASVRPRLKVFLKGWLNRVDHTKLI